jgi:hypothetical protein
MAIPMEFNSRRLKSQPLSSPCLKPGASRSFFGETFSATGKLRLHFSPKKKEILIIALDNTTDILSGYTGMMLTVDC